MKPSSAPDERRDDQALLEEGVLQRVDEGVRAGAFTMRPADGRRWDVVDDDGHAEVLEHLHARAERALEHVGGDDLVGACPRRRSGR